jgi:transcriptional regulator with XRE-family HTH domain
MPRSLFVKTDYIPIVKSLLLRHGFPSQKLLAEQLGIAQSTVSNFLNGRPVDFINFLEICRILAQEWREVADLSAHNEQIHPQSNSPIIVISDRLHSPPGEKLKNALSDQGLTVFLLEENSENNDYFNQADYLVLLLSEKSIFHEMVISDIQEAKFLQQKNPDKPAILPICVNFSDQIILPFDLWGHLQGITTWKWSENELIPELLLILQQHRKALIYDHQLSINLQAQIAPKSPVNPPLSSAFPELPEGQVELDSQFYIQRFPIEERCLETIIKPCALIRIKAPRQMGKTSLLARILHHAEKNGDRTVCLSLQLANQRVFNNSETFLQWFCASISLELGLLQPEQLNKYWQLAEMIGANQCCKAYFEQYLLPQINAPLTLGLDEVDRVFEQPEIADDFFGLLRSLHEEGKRRDIWKNLRLIVVHSTEVYIPLDVNKSPFNVGLPIELPEFNQEQVLELAIRHGLNWQEQQITEILKLLGGHPYLLRLTMYHVVKGDRSFIEIIKDAVTATGIYSDHLKRHLWNLQKYPELMTAMATVVKAESPVIISTEAGFKLNSMGLVNWQGNKVFPRCQLYAKYFGNM